MNGETPEVIASNRYDMRVVVDGEFRFLHRNVSPFRVLREMQWSRTWKIVRWEVFIEPHWNYPR